MCDCDEINVFPVVKFCAGEGAHSKMYAYKLVFFHQTSICLSRCQTYPYTVILDYVGLDYLSCFTRFGPCGARVK